MSASIILVGNLAQDPELKFTGAGKALAKLAVVTSKRKKNDQTGQWEDTDTTFWNVTVWDKTAEHVADSLQKGDPVIVNGTAAERSWQNDAGEKRSRVEVNATNIAIDLRRWSVNPNRASGVQTYSAGKAPVENDPWATAGAASSAASEESFPF